MDSEKLGFSHSFFDNLDGISISETSFTQDEELVYNPIHDSSRIYATETFIVSVREHPPALPFEMDSLLVSEQEGLLSRDLLYLLTGAEASLITVHSVTSFKIGFTVDSRVDHSLRDQVLEIAQVAGYHYTIQKYLERACDFEHGKVNHALVAAMKPLLREYHLLLAQLETMYTKNELSLQNFWFHIHPSVQQLSLLSTIASSIQDRGARGGEVLSILQAKTVVMSGDEVGKKICLTLADAASQPYFRILENWIYKGKIRDQFREFFISEGSGHDRKDGEFGIADNYWEKSYKIDMKQCPTFLFKVSNEILKSGKYLNVIRQCGRVIGKEYSERIIYNIHEHYYVDAIQRAYSFASKALLDMLLKDYDIMRRIESMKHFLLMDQGDFIVQFLDLTEDELRKKVDDLNETRLTSLLELAVRTSSSCTDPYKDFVKVELFPSGIRDMLLNTITIGSALENLDTVDTFTIPGVEAFSLKFEVNWPVSLVLNDRAILNYQLVFRHLFFCKHVERQLCQVWIDGKVHKQTQLKDNIELTAAFALRQKMLNFVQNLLYYMAFEVIEPAWHNFLNTMNKVQNIDQVMQAHSTFLSSIVHESMLTNSDPLDKITALLSYCLQFSTKFAACKPQPTRSRSLPPISIIEYDKGFSSLLVQFLREVSNTIQIPQQSSKVMNIIHRMNFNGFYSQALNQDTTSCSLTT